MVSQLIDTPVILISIYTKFYHEEKHLALIYINTACSNTDDMLRKMTNVPSVPHKTVLMKVTFTLKCVTNFTVGQNIQSCFWVFLERKSDNKNLPSLLLHHQSQAIVIEPHHQQTCATVQMGTSIRF